MKFLPVILLLMPMGITVYGQSLADTSSLEEVVIKAYFSDRPLLRAPASVSVINSDALKNQPEHTLIPAINTVPGVRMEERSPGSYRLSIRGSLLRSPFGIRNIKVYLDDFLLTDAGGNTYLNLLDASSIGRVEILKGPEGSVFGANSGGVVLLHTRHFNTDSTSLNGGLTVGSYGLVHQHISTHVQKNNVGIRINEAFQRADGYRHNSAMKRLTLQIMPEWRYSKSAQLKSLILFSDLDYQTPGGLTVTQSQQDPRLARPSAKEQQAAIYNKTFLTGISHTKQFNSYVRHVISLTATITDFKNPFITNYETRSEKSLGMRTYIELLSKRNKWEWQTGLEAQETSSKIRNYENVKGEPGNSKNFVDLNTDQSFVFTRLSTEVLKNLKMETALSANLYKYHFSGLYPNETGKETREFNPQLLPRLALSYRIGSHMALRASASRGYSAPGIEEVRPSNLVVNTDLEPEQGWNFETGLRLSLLKSRIYFDGVVFQFNLNDAIVRRVDAADADFFVNAGGTKQTGLETQLIAWISPLQVTGFLRGLKMTNAYTYSHFNFRNYMVNKTNFSGNNLTGVPTHNFVSSAECDFPAEVQLYIQYNYVSAIPLNDANSVFADKYHLLQTKVSCQKKFPTYTVKFYAGADNLLNARYSLGNDLNAFGARFYNPAPPVNFYGGISLQF